MTDDAVAGTVAAPSQRLVPLAGLVVFAAVWIFVMTRDFIVLAIGLLLGLVPFYGLVVYWVWRDANERGMPAALWTVVVVFLFVLGLALYLVVRELRPREGKAA